MKTIGSYRRFVELSEKAFIKELDRQLDEAEAVKKSETEKDIMNILKDRGYVKRTGFEE